MPSKEFKPKTPYDSRLKEKARDLRNNLTPAEKRFWNALRKMPFYKALSFNRQKSFGNYIVDFYCHQLALVIEIDGHTHGEELSRQKDKKRTQFLESNGLKVVRFTNEEVINNIEGVMAQMEVLVEK